jgi:hypothetical protein
MTDTNRTPQPPAAYVPPTQASVTDRLNSLLLEIDHPQVHTELSGSLRAARDLIVRAKACIDAHCDEIAKKAVEAEPASI